MPVEFLSDDQVAAYERFVSDLTRSELEGFFLLDSTALDLIADKRGPHTRLGAALQVGTVRAAARSRHLIGGRLLSTRTAARDHLRDPSSDIRQ